MNNNYLLLLLLLLLLPINRRVKFPNVIDEIHSSTLISKELYSEIYNSQISL